MKKGIFLAILLLVLGSMGVAKADRGDKYLMAKFGFMQFHTLFDRKKKEELENVDPLVSAGVLFGIGVTRNITFEGELNGSLAGGKFSSNVEDGDFQVYTIAGYGVYRYPFLRTAYVKGKMGLLFECVIRNSTLKETQEEQDPHKAGFCDPDSGLFPPKGASFAAGIGFGVLLRNSLTIEFEFSSIEQNIIFYSLGVNYPF